MRDHDVESEQTVDAARQRTDDQTEAAPAREVAHGIAAGRPDALGPAGLLHLQATAGNSGVSALVAQRAAAATDRECDEAEAPGRSPVADVVSGSGRPLEPGLRASMEASLGHDFGSVRVHDDGQAAASARSVQAHAYTAGEHVVFGEGRYQPDSTDGRRTLAHELTHVVQQRQGPVDGTAAPGGVQISHPDDPFEREAESVADRVMASPEPTPPTTDPTPSAAPAPVPTEAPVQRQAAEEEEEEAGPAAAEPTTEQPAAESATEASATESPAAESPAQEEAPGEAPVATPAGEEVEEEESLTGD